MGRKVTQLPAQLLIASTSSAWCGARPRLPPARGDPALPGRSAAPMAALTAARRPSQSASAACCPAGAAPGEAGDGDTAVQAASAAAADRSCSSCAVALAGVAAGDPCMLQECSSAKGLLYNQGKRSA